MQQLKKELKNNKIAGMKNFILNNSMKIFDFLVFERPYSARVGQPCIVKFGTSIHVLNGRTDISQSARRLEVLKQCIGYIFSDKTAEAKKTSGAVFYSIKSHEDARIALCNELASYKKQNK